MSETLTYWSQDDAGPPLSFSTGAPAVDAILRGVIGLIELQFPGRVRGYYLQGGYADGSAVPASDIDLRVVFQGELGAEEQERCTRLIDCCRLISPIALDSAPEGEASLLRVGAVRFQHGTRLLYGEDIRPQVPLKPLAAYVRDTLHTAFLLSARVRGNPPVLSMPLDYPDPAGEFYGYDRRRQRGSDGWVGAGTKDLVATATAIASGLVGLAGHYTTSKTDSVAQYRRQIGGAWADYLDEVMDLCRGRWGYRVPDSPEERVRLRELCRRSLAFEHAFFTRYHAYLAEALTTGDTADAQLAARRLERLRFDDAEVKAAPNQAGNT